MDKQPQGATDDYNTALEQAGIDLLGMDLGELGSVDHPVLAAVLHDLRERIAAPGSESLWGFDNAG